MRILFLSSWFPYPPDNGSRIRVYNLLKHLSRDHEITLLSFIEEGRGNRGRDGLRSLCRSVQTVTATKYCPGRLRAMLGFLSSSPRSIVDTYSGAMAELVRRSLFAESYDVVVASQIGTAPYVPVSTDVPACFDEIELQVIRDSFTYAVTPFHRFRTGLTWLKLRRYLPGLMERFGACTVASAREQSNVREIASGYDRVHVVPNGVDLDHCRPGLMAPVPDSLIYTGSLTYGANYDAVSYFLREVYPLIRAEAPNAEVSITGSVQGVALESLPQHGGVKYTGYLEDIRPAVASAWACIVPLRIGGGTRLKILEAMALGTPVISSSKGAEGLEVTPGETILLADEPAEFAAQTVRLLRDSGLRQCLARNARQLVEQKYGWACIGGQFNDVLHSLLPRGAAK